MSRTFFKSKNQQYTDRCRVLWHEIQKDTKKRAEFQKKALSLYHQTNNEKLIRYTDTKTLEHLYPLVYQTLVQDFYKKNKRFPRATEYKHDNILPDARYVQRNFGGLTTFRQLIGLDETDYTKGLLRRSVAKKCMARAKKYEHELYVLLHKKHHNPDKNVVVEREPVISRPEPETDYGYKRADVAIHKYTDNGRKTIYFDFFYASEDHSFKACVRHKFNKVKDLLSPGQITFVSVNPRYNQEEIDQLYFPEGCPQVISFDAFINCIVQ